MKVYDLLILGAGPAGITAAVYCSRKKMDFLVISEDIGGQTTWSGDIENYTGYQFITGPDLTLKFQEHMKVFDININTEETVKDIKKKNNLFCTITSKSQYQSKTLIVATGKQPKPLGTEGEDKFKGRGLTYCATCDGPLFKGKDVAIIGGGNSGLEAALQMMKISPKVYIINITEELTGDPIMVEKVKEASNIEIINKSKVRRIYGDNFVNGLEAEKEGKVYNLDVKGIFVEVGLIPNSKFASIINCNESKEIIIDQHNQTNIEGIFAAGDVTDVIEKQIIIACGEGSKASLAAFRYLATHRF